MRDVHELDVVALLTDVPDDGLCKGQVGTVVETLAPEIFEVEFADDQGRCYATASLHQKDLLVRRYVPAET